MCKLTGLRIAFERGLIALTICVVPLAEAAASDPEKSEKALEEAKIKLDEVSQDLAEEYLDILEQLRETVEDYSEYLSELKSPVCEDYPISLGMFTKGLRSGRYTESHEQLVSDIEDFIHDLRRIEREYQDAPDASDRRCYRTVRNLKREMNILMDLTEDHVDHVHATKVLNENLQLYLEEALRSVTVALRNHKEELEDILEITAEMPRAPPVPQPDKGEKGLPPAPSIYPPVAQKYVGKRGEVGLVRKFSDSLVVRRSDRTIHITNPLGDIHITGWGKDIVAGTFQIEIKAESRADEKEFVSASSLDMRSSADGYMVRADLPGLSDPSTKILASALTVSVPSGNLVNCENAFGEVLVSNLGHGLDVAGQHSDIRLVNIHGDVSVENSAGPITLKDVTGSMHVENCSSPIEISVCDGDMTIKNAFASITLSDSRGQVSLRNSGNVTVRGHTGDVAISNTYGRVEVSRLNGNLQADNAFQPLMISGVRGMAELVSTYAKANVRDIGGLLTATTKFGQFWGEDLRGPLKVHGENGAIKLVLDRELSGSSSVTATYGTIDLALGESSDVYLKAHTIDGDIHTLLPLQILDEGTAKSTEHRFGRGRNPLAVSGKNTSISITSTR